MKKLLLSLKKPSVFIPLALGLALLVALLSFSNLAKVLALLAGFQRLDLLFYLLLMAAYEMVRGVQWGYSLKRLAIRAPLTSQIFAFALSEVTKVLPIGNYFQNYVLQEEKGVDFGRTSAATTLFILEEVVVSLTGVVILGLGAWTTWTRVVILVGAAVTVAVVWLLARLHVAGHRPDWIARRKALNKVADEFGRFREGAVDLLHPRPLAVTLACSLTYLVLGGAALYVAVVGLGIPNVSFPEALSVYFFSLAVALMLPIPIDIGVIEISGLGAFLAIGVSRDAGLGAVLANRILSILASIAIAAVIVLILRKEARALFSFIRQGESRSGQQSAVATDTTSVGAAEGASERNARDGAHPTAPGAQEETEQPA